MRGFCEVHGSVEAETVRRNFNYCGVEVKNALAIQCTKCNHVIGIPNESNGRIAKALRDAGNKADNKFFNLSFPESVADSVLKVQAYVGSGSKLSEGFQIAAVLGLRLFVDNPRPDSAWKIFDTERRTVEAHFQFTNHMAKQLELLQVQWGANNITEVLQWLIVASGLASDRGIAPMNIRNNTNKDIANSFDISKETLEREASKKFGKDAICGSPYWVDSETVRVSISLPSGANFGANFYYKEGVFK